MENVKGLLNHDKGQFLFDILQELADLSYFVKWKLINAKHYGPPQNRERVYFVGFHNFREYKKFEFPNVKSTFEERCQKKVECIDLNKTVENCYYAENAGWAGKRAIEQVRSFDFGVGDMFLWRVNRMCKISEDMIPTLVRESSLFCHCPSIVDYMCRLRSLTVAEGAYIQGFFARL